MIHAAEVKVGEDFLGFSEDGTPKTRVRSRLVEPGEYFETDHATALALIAGGFAVSASDKAAIADEAERRAAMSREALDPDSEALI